MIRPSTDEARTSVRKAGKQGKKVRGSHWADFLARILELHEASPPTLCDHERRMPAFSLFVCPPNPFCRDVNGDELMDVIVGAYGSTHLSAGAAHVVYGTNTSAAYEASFLDLGGGSDGGLDGIDGFTLSGVSMEFPLYAELVRSSFLTWKFCVGLNVT